MIESSNISNTGLGYDQEIRKNHCVDLIDASQSLSEIFFFRMRWHHVQNRKILIFVEIKHIENVEASFTFLKLLHLK